VSQRYLLGKADQVKNLSDSMLTVVLMALVYIAAIPIWAAFNSYRVRQWLGESWN
jgi:hypothetical protein